MIVSHDIFTLTVLIIVLLFACCKGGGKEKPGNTYLGHCSDDRFQTREMKERDRLWQMMKEKGIKNDYELWLFKQTDEYKRWLQDNKD